MTVFWPAPAAAGGVLVVADGPPNATKPATSAAPIATPTRAGIALGRSGCGANSVGAGGRAAPPPAVTFAVSPSPPRMGHDSTRRFNEACCKTLHQAEW